MLKSFDFPHSWLKCPLTNWMRKFWCPFLQLLLLIKRREQEVAHSSFLDDVLHLVINEMLFVWCECGASALMWFLHSSLSHSLGGESTHFNIVLMRAGRPSLSLFRPRCTHTTGGILFDLEPSAESCALAHLNSRIHGFLLSLMLICVYCAALYGALRLGALKAASWNQCESGLRSRAARLLRSAGNSLNFLCKKLLYFL